MKINEPYFSYSIGIKIKNIRLASNMTLENLSEKSGLSIEKLSEIEAGTLSIQIEEFIIIARVLNIVASELLEGIE